MACYRLASDSSHTDSRLIRQQESEPGMAALVSKAKVRRRARTGQEVSVCGEQMATVIDSPWLPALGHRCSACRAEAAT